MEPLTILTILSTLSAGVWSIWKWADQQKKGREEKRDAMAALYVNSFMTVAEVLQERLYSILEKGDLKCYQEEYPGPHNIGSPPAIELLYLLCQFFGWANYAYRYGPYTNDERAIKLLIKISEAFVNRSSFSGEAFRFSIPEQTALGWATVKYTGQNIDSYPEYQGITLFEFEDELKNGESKHFSLYQTKTVRQTLDAIDRAKDIKELEGRERLIEIQSLLVDLLDHIESMEGFSVALNPRRIAKTGEGRLVNSQKSSPGSKVAHHINGRIRVVIPKLRQDKVFSDHLRSALESMADIKKFRLNTMANCITIWYEPVVALDEIEKRILATIERASDVESAI